MMMMRFTTVTIQEAFRLHGEVYHKRKGWDIPYHVECWKRAASAFQTDSLDDFTWLYGEIGRSWSAFRRAVGPCWSAERTFHHLRGLDEQCRDRSLGHLTDADLIGLRDVLNGLAGIKPVKNAPSIVAVSKFLHALNPHLFVIVDDAIMWRFVFRHRWLWELVARERKRISTIVKLDGKVGDACDLLSYLAIMRWSAELIRVNPTITSAFAEHVQQHARADEFVSRLHTYEAAAVEWFLLGVVELPPTGITRSGHAGD